MITIDTEITYVAKVDGEELNYPPYTPATKFIAVEAVRKWLEDTSIPVSIGVETIEGDRREIKLTEETEAEIITEVHPKLPPIFGEVNNI